MKKHKAQIPVEIRAIRFGATIPAYATEGAAAIDLVACFDDPVAAPNGKIRIVAGHPSVLIPTGLSIHIKDPNYCAIILPRSGLGHKQGLVLGNGVGLIDSDYQGELMVSAWVRPNHSSSMWPNEVQISNGDRIAQLLFLPIVHAAFTTVEEFSGDSDRGEKGFGSTGMR